MAISWTKDWAGSDDGTLFKGVDLANLQSDIAANIGNATSIQGFDIDVPASGDDDALIFYDHTNSKFEYIAKGTANQLFAMNSGATAHEYTSTPSVTSLTAANLIASTNLALATGATVTGIADEDDMASDSNTLLATQQSIKAYVATQTRIKIFTASGSGTWVAPSGTTEAIVTIVGGGGGGGSGHGGNDGFAGGGGGGGGETSLNNVFKITAGNTYNFSIGAGGAGGASVSSGVGNAGAAGSNTTFTGDLSPTNHTITAVAGGGGAGGTTGSTAGGSAGGADVVSLVGGAHDVAFAGGVGGTGETDTVGDGGGGGSTYITKALGLNTGAAGTAGGNGVLGGGGQGGTPQSGSSGVGGTGGTGMIIIKY